jgi:hypothetical protein
MRKIHRDSVYARENLADGHAKRREAFAAHNGELPRRPDAGTPLKTVHVTDHLTGQSYTLEIVQGERKNGIDVFRFGCRVDCGGSFDGLFRMLRRNWALRWLTA